MNRHRTFTRGLIAATALLAAGASFAQAAKVKVGLMLPYTGTFPRWARPSRTAFACTSRKTAASSPAARSSSCAWTTSPTRPRPATTSTS